MKKIIAIMTLVAFTFVMQAQAGDSCGDKAGCDKAKTEGKTAGDKKADDKKA